MFLIQKNKYLTKQCELGLMDVSRLCFTVKTAVRHVELIKGVLYWGTNTLIYLEILVFSVEILCLILTFSHKPLYFLLRHHPSTQPSILFQTRVRSLIREVQNYCSFQGLHAHERAFVSCVRLCLAPVPVQGPLLMRPAKSHNPRMRVCILTCRGHPMTQCAGSKLNR